MSWALASMQPGLQQKVGQQKIQQITKHPVGTGPPADCKHPQAHSSGAYADVQLSSHQQDAVLPAEQPDAGAPSSGCSPGRWLHARPGTEG